MQTISTYQAKSPLDDCRVVFGLGEAPAKGRIELTNKQGASIGTFEIVEDCWAGSPADMPAILLELALDPCCRIYSGMLQYLMTEKGAPLDASDVAWAATIREVEAIVVQPARPRPTWRK